MALSVGARLGPYEILAFIGAGGMGEVYRARDIRLDRTVAIKILPKADPERRQRFAREAKAIAALSHPNICVLYDVGEERSSSDGSPIDFIVIEYLEGETLADRLKNGKLPPDTCLDLALHITDALEAAHAAGIVHRDLKPQNIFLTRRGSVKILDFGLAKLESRGQDTFADLPPTVTAEPALTSPGTAIGTIAYMSPEQARGETTDARTDVFSFGAVLYEMVSGHPAFSGRTTAVIIDKLLNETPPRAAGAPPPFEAFIHKALEKDRRNRWQSASEMRVVLEGLRAQGGSGPGLKRASGTLWQSRVQQAGIAFIALLLVVAAAVGAARRWFVALPTTGRAIDSIAVLPFVNASRTPDADYLSEGLADSLTNSLAQINGLRVVPRTLAARYNGASVDPHEAGITLNARALVTGRVAQHGDRFTVQAELIDASTVAQLWGDQFDRPLTDVLAVQMELSKSIADNLRLRLTPEDQQSLTAGAPKEAVAYQLYLKGRHETTQRTREGYAAATSYFEQAIARDPTYARAYAGLADVYLWQAYWGYLPAGDTYGKALSAANQAVAIDEKSAEAHASLGWLDLYYRWNWADSDREYQRALALEPTNAAVMAWYGESLSSRGRHEEAIAEVRRAVALDPLSAQTMNSLAFVLLNARRYEEAIDIQKRAVGMARDATLPLLDLSRAYRLAGKADLAIETSERMLSSGDPLGPAFVAASYAHGGRTAEARALARKMSHEAARTGQGYYLIGLVYAALGDTDAAVQALEEAYRAHDTFLPWLNADPEFDPVRHDPRFADLVKRVGIPDR